MAVDKSRCRIPSIVWANSDSNLHEYYGHILPTETIFHPSELR